MSVDTDLVTSGADVSADVRRDGEQPSDASRLPSEVSGGGRGRRSASRWGRARALATMALGPIIVLAAALVVWEVLTATGVIKSYVLPPPRDVFQAMVDNWDVYLRHARTSGAEAILGFVLGNSVAVLLAVMFVHSGFLERSVYPLTLASRSIPVVALGPVMVLWLGTGMVPKALIAAFLVFFPTLVNMMRGLRAVDPGADELFHTLSANWWQRLWKVRLPASLPFLLASLKIAAGTCFLGAVVAEWIGANQGLGYLIVVYASQYQVEELWGAVIVTSLLSVLAFLVIVIIEWWTMPWARGQSDNGIV